MSRSLLAIVLAAACGSSSPPPAKPSRTAADLGPMCYRHYARQAVCADEYLGALIDLRVELDLPKGIREEVAKDGRQVVIERARVEWRRDTAPEMLDKICKAIVEVPADQVDRLLRQGDTCLASADCKAFAACAVADERTYIASGATHAY